MQELNIFYNLPPVIKFCDERGLVGINILVVQILAYGGQGDVYMYAVYSDVLKWVMFCGGIPPMYL